MRLSLASWQLPGGDKDGEDDDDLLHKRKERYLAESYQRCHFLTDTWTQSRSRLAPGLGVDQLSKKGFN